MRGLNYFYLFFIYLSKTKRGVFAIKKAFVLFFCILLICASFSACSDKKAVPCREIIEALTGAEIGLPAGKIYDVNAPEGDGEYLDERLISSLFGEGSPPPMRQGWLDIALFLPTSSHPCEFAAILCDSPDTATDTARLLCRRLDLIRSAKSDGDSSDMLDSAIVTIIGNYAILIISSDAENSIKAVTKRIA